MAASNEFTLSNRQRTVLFALCRHYVLTAQPVSSGALSRRYGIRWSSATIRAELSVLEQAGYLVQPHTAAGRVPTTRGLSAFIEAIEAREPRDEHRRLVDLSIADAGSSRDGVAMTTRVLAELAGCVAIGFVGAPRSEVLTGLRLVATQPGRALAVLGFRDGRSGMHRLDLEPELFERLPDIEHRLAALTVGRTLDEAREHLGALLAAYEDRVDAALGQAIRIGLLMCTAGLFDPLWLSVLGQPSLARELARGWGKEPLFGDRLGALLGLLEDYQRLADLLCQLLPSASGEDVPGPSAEVRLGLGLEASPPHALAAREGGLSLIGCRLPSLQLTGEIDGAREGPEAANPSTGAIAVLGASSMDYESVIPLVEYAARALSTRSADQEDA